MLHKLQLKIPPLLLMLVVAGLIWFIPDTTQPTWSVDGWHFWVAGFLFDLGCLIAVFGVISFKKAQTTVNPIAPEQASTLVTRGIYKLTRNPMYLGFLSILLAVTIFRLNVYGLLFCALFVWLMNELQIKPEEQALERLFGEDYRQYMERVRRWI